MLLLFSFMLNGQRLFAQEQNDKRIIQFSGVIVGEDSTSGVGGVHVYVPKAGRGTISNNYGYFSMPALAGDSVVISAVGYAKQHFVIPDREKQSYTVIIELESDTLYLPEVEIMPYPNERIFKEAVLAFELPYQDDLDALSRNMDEEMMARMLRDMPMSAGGNFRNLQNQYFFQTHDRYSARMNPFTNIFAWKEFIQSIKRGDFKKKN